MNNQEVSNLIDRIIYLSSLVSKRQDIDQMMDTLRITTSRWKSDEQMADGDQKQLLDLENELKMYLVTRDPLRSFTLESLEKRLQDKPTRTKTPTLSEFGLIVIISLVVGLCAFAASFSAGLQARALLCVALFFVTLHIGIAWLYISALKNFKSTFRSTYVYLGAAAILLSIGFTHFILINLLELDRYAAFHYGGVTWLISLPFILMFLGLRHYTVLLQIKTPYTSLALAGAFALATALVIGLLPHRPVEAPLYFRIWTIGAWMIPIFALLCCLLAGRIRRVVTAAYARSMTWLYYYTLVVGFGSLIAGGMLFWMGELYGERLAAVIAACGIPPQLVLLYASYSFKRETSK